MQRRFYLIVLLAALMLLGGCAQPSPVQTAQPSTGQPSPGQPSPAPDDAFTVVTSFYPMYVLTANVVGDAQGVELVNMAEQQTGCLHDYQLLPADMQALERADVFVINGAGMESFMSRVSEQFADLTVITASEGVEMIVDAYGEPNAHVWLDPARAAQQVERIAAGLAEADPQRAEIYRQNGAAYAQRLRELGGELREQLADAPKRDIITFHEAFPYFAEAFDLNIAAVVEREPGSEPTTQEIARTVDIVREAGITALFVEPQYPDRAAETIARETGASLYTLDPIVTGELSGDAYEEKMRQNAATLLEALGS